MATMQELLKLMVERKASDLHLTVGRPPQLRVDGKLTLTDGGALTPEITRDLAFSILSDQQIEIFEKDRELDFSYGISGVGRFRVNLYRQRSCVAVAMRHIPFTVPTIEDLGLPEMAREFSDKPNGLVLVTGPTGSGKSTTLAAMIRYINERRSCHIISIEDPIEYLHKHGEATVNQREVGSDTISFPEALRHVVRQDPNVIMVGEMRDLETIHTALTLAETGHLILATLHTSDATHAVSRIVDVFAPYQQQQIRVQLSMVLAGVMVQQLIPRKDKAGRVLVTEVMNVTPSIANMIRDNNLPQIYSCIQTGKRLGMHTMNQSLRDLFKEGLISYDEALRRSTDPDELRGLMGVRK